MARLKRGVTVSQAGQDVSAISAALAREYPATNRDRQIHALSLVDQTLGYSRPALLTLMAAAALFMLIGCSNVANLVLARSLARQREIAMLAARGASRRPLAHQFVTESCCSRLGAECADICRQLPPGN